MSSEQKTYPSQFEKVKAITDQREFRHSLRATNFSST